jgi:hypothetical protein
MQVETIQVTLVTDDGGCTSLEIPAFTVNSSALELRVQELLTEYIERSVATGNATSLGDFCLYLLAIAEDDPKEM